MYMAYYLMIALWAKLNLYKTFKMTDERDVKKILEYITSYANINLDDVIQDMNKKDREKFIKQNHSFSIWQGKDTRWRTYIADETRANGRRLIVKSSKEALEKFLLSQYEAESKEQKLKQYTLKQLYPEWIEYKRLHTTAETYIMRINTDWKTYYLGTSIIDTPIPKLDKLTLDKWAHKLIQDYEMTKNQYFNVTVIMRQALLYAVDLGIIQSSPFSEVHIDGKRLFRKTKKKADCKQVFSKEETKNITAMAWEDYHNHVKVYELAPLAVLFQMQTGLRIGEVCAVKYSDIEHPDYIHIQRMVRRDTKEVVPHTKSDCGDRQVLLTSTAKKLIQTARERQKELKIDSEYIFSVNGLPLTERSISTLYTKYCKHMGIMQKSSHTARRTFISALIDGQVSINTVRATAGHASERTTLNNYTFDRSTEAEKQQKFENALAY